MFEHCFNIILVDGPNGKERKLCNNMVAINTIHFTASDSIIRLGECGKCGQKYRSIVMFELPEQMKKSIGTRQNAE